MPCTGLNRRKRWPKRLAETQKQIWKHWCDLIPGVPSPTPFYSGPPSQAGEEAAEGFKAWTAESAQVVKDVADRLLTSQQELLRFLELAMRAWKAIASKIETGGDWDAVLLNFTETLRQQLLQLPQEMQKAFQDSSELWRTLLRTVERVRPALDRVVAPGSVARRSGIDRQRFSIN